MVRRTLDSVMPQLPQVRFEIKHVETNGAVKKALEAEKMLHIDPESLKGIDAKVLGHISIVRREMGLAIAPQAAQYIATLIEGGEEKLFVVGWHIEVLNILERALKKFGLVRVDGSVSPVQRQIRVNQFVADPAQRIFLGNITAIGIGTDGLQKVCSHIVGVECSWTSGDNDQVVARLKRMGQKESVLAEWLTAEGSFGERILGSSLRKLRSIYSALDKQHGSGLFIPNLGDI